MLAEGGDGRHHPLDPRDVVVGGAEELEEALHGILPEDTHPAGQTTRQLGEAGVGGGEAPPHTGERHAEVEVVAKRGAGGFRRVSGGAVAAVEEEGHATLLIAGVVPEGEEMGADDAGELVWPRLPPPEGLPGRQSEGEGQLRTRDAEGLPSAISHRRRRGGGGGEGGGEGSPACWGSGGGFPGSGGVRFFGDEWRRRRRGGGAGRGGRRRQCLQLPPLDWGRGRRRRSAEMRRRWRLHLPSSGAPP